MSTLIWGNLCHSEKIVRCSDAHSSPAEALLCTAPGYACAPGTPCASRHNTMPARSLSLHGKRGELAQVSYLTSPHSPCAPSQYIFGAASRASNRAAVLPPHTTASRLSLPPAMPWGGDTLPAVPRVPCHPGSPPMSRSLEIAAAARYHAAWSFGGGRLCNNRRLLLMRSKRGRTNLQRGMCPF